jgi:hypothetical protein
MHIQNVPFSKRPTLKMSHSQNVPSLNVPHTKRPTAQNIPLSKRATLKTSHALNVARHKTSPKYSVSICRQRILNDPDNIAFYSHTPQKNCPTLYVCSEPSNISLVGSLHLPSAENLKQPSQYCLIHYTVYSCSYV